ncbi:uncharacterized protein LOC119432422 [Dermacentor silvarum]|uniref:uncharacterized protein LOC119432422 n=1 Tax=Dermacentor silvarum TaxID=543639 RepID=UPI00189723DD|nr:uncharacterized protein LOC119432422 [Dermacentor silvarum]XP_049514896.1 uncharacterized protein LOC119432422 [Dermacentor silvarum]XP_049514897.1 uncharacterized protein LOC119432422 [Dermacentor silvarum]XP_049514898.1 uncharacterized protein LOC119432422 [Dermacentor silvarum]XP_049514899.1 uncharacterized protein LOC119432422 [Dermacentor silvarum]
MTWYDLSSFVDHREHLLEEAFGALSPDELNILTPVELQNIPLEELKQLCMQQLQRMTRARLLAVLQDPLVKLWTSNSKDDAGPQSSSDRSLQGILSQRAQKNSSIEQEYRDISSMCTAAQMEILELELRARAIRSLMSAKARDTTAKSTAAPPSDCASGYGPQ